MNHTKSASYKTETVSEYLARGGQIHRLPSDPRRARRELRALQKAASRIISLIAPALFGILLFSACSTVPQNRSGFPVEDFEEKIASRSNGASGRPAWLDETRAFWTADGEVHSMGQSSLDGDGRVEMGYRIAEGNAKASLSSAIEQRLESIFQSAEEGTGVDAHQYRYVGSEVTRMTTSSLRVKGRYWERVLTRDSTGSPVVRYRIFSLITMPEADFRRALQKALHGAGKGGVSPEFARKVDERWSAITETAAK